MTRPETSFLNHQIAVKKPVAISFDRRRQSLYLERSVFRSDTQQDEPGDLALPAKDQIAKILILGEQDSLLAGREPDDIHIVQACGRLGDVQHVMAKQTQG